MMSLNIKNEETCRLADELARLTGDTKTGAITIALKERLEREKRLRDADALMRDLRAIGERCSKLIGPGISSTDHGDLLYDEHGAPK
ncbi:type II toxin-antitoxin system VapB family antitoxin [Candidatus Palauibacter sp.]|uniref:type II toxin-antitoxin system VapB family antitoxin n=1 Tax=Candidatus Palauibacter sp. TaxID=3101350 RepID=UPI003B52111C